MRFQFLGTAAAEGWPGVFCNCEYCREAIRLGGANIRTRCQSLVGEDLLLDFGPDTYLHKLQHGLDLSRVKFLLITHMHMDHFNPAELTIRGGGYSHDMVSEDLHVYLSREALDFFYHCARGELSKDVEAHLHFHVLKAFDPVSFGPYRVMPLPAHHMGKENEPFIYHMEQTEEKKHIYYLHDSGWYADEVWEYFASQKEEASLVSLDATFCRRETELANGHMGIPRCMEVKKRMEEMGLVTSKSRVFINHFSHNGYSLHAEMENLARPYGCEVAYDGRLVEL